MSSDDDQSDAPEQPFLLPRYIRFARTVALVGGVAVGVAAGVAIVGTAGCGGCTGICGLPPPTLDASADADHDAGVIDGSGGGPRPAPLLPRAWTA